MNKIALVPKAVTLNQTALIYNVINIDATKQEVTIFYKLLSDTNKLIEQGNKVLPLSALAALNTPNDLAAINAVLAQFGIVATTPPPPAAPAPDPVPSPASPISTATATTTPAN